MRPMRLLGLKTFRHGVHPPESKDETSGLAIRQFPFAPLLIVPLVQHMGAPSLPVVEEGQEVHRGQRSLAPTASCRSPCTHRLPAWCAGSPSGPASAAAWCRRCTWSRFPAPRRKLRKARPARSTRPVPTRSLLRSRMPAWSGSGARRFQPTSSSRSPRASSSTR